jgi:hypothetical protein
MPKVIFILRRKAGTTREACLKYWEGEQHTAIVRTMPGLTKWVQNHDPHFQPTPRQHRPQTTQGVHTVGGCRL